MSELWPAPTASPELQRREGAPTDAAQPETVLFVCEHGIAKSLIARLLFERYAREAGLTVRAESRATAPDGSLPPWVLAGLGAKRLDAGGFSPRPLDDDALKGATRVVSFDLPDVATTASACAVTGEQWDGVPHASEDFDASHAAIDQRVRELVQRLVAERSR
jgi:arsenate reductase